MLSFRPAIVAILVVFSGCKPPAKDADKHAEPATEKPSVPSVHFRKIVERSLPPTLAASGTLAADESSEVAAPAAGLCVKVEVDVGSRVKKGDVLVQLDPRDPSLRLSQANAATAQAFARLGIKSGEPFNADRVADVRAAKEAMDLAVADAERTKSLFDTGSVSQATWDQARTHAEQTRAQYEAAHNGAQQSWAALMAAQAQAGQAQKAMGDAAIRAPFDGAIAERRISPGEFAQTGRVVVVLVRDNPLRLRVDVPEAEAGRVSVGQDVLITVAAFPGLPFHGQVKRISASVKAQSRALPIEAEVPNAEGKLKPGFFARAEIALGGADVSALLVPRAAVGSTGTASRVFVRAGDHVVERLVTVGREVEGLIEVRGNVAASDEVAVDEVDRLSDGADVKVAM